MKLEQHYKDNFNKLVKRMSYRSGTQWDGEDIVNEAYARALKYSASYRDEGFDKWFNTVLNNTFKDHKRNENGMSHSSLDEELIEGTECQHYNDQIIKEIYDLISTKSSVQIEILDLHWRQEMTAIEISKTTDHSYSNCHQIIRRFRQELKELYG
jgi:RNA polymerase sigma factor (sigma-70 family)